MNLLITGAWANARAHLSELEALGHSVSFLQQEGDPLPCDPASVEAVVCNGLFLYHPLSAFPALRLVQLTSAGFDRVDLPELKRRGIPVFNARGVYSAPMAEFALAGVLALYKQLRFFARNQQARCWKKHRGLLELGDKTVTILGCGSVGTECARRFSAFGCRVLGVDLIPPQDPTFASRYPLEQLNAILPQTDILVLTLPLSPDTRGLIDASRLALLRPGALLVNISRGPVVVEDALIRALESGQLGGAVLDVFETEPLSPDSPIWAMEQVLLSPHNSFVGEGNARRLSRLILDNLRGI